jgi:NADPH:quinone reductase-like Zn-dependent oxidoreductase
MKAAVHSKYGLPGDLTIKDVDKPTPNDDEVLVKLHATSANRTDCFILLGKPAIMRFFTGLFKPRVATIGTDFAGEIEAVGANVKSFTPGEKIMGFGGAFDCGSHAEYFILSERIAGKTIVAKPANIDYDEAAACLEGTFYAASILLQVKPKPGQKALVYGATGAIGSAYVQFLKYFGVYVTAVCRAENFELVKSLGADKLIDYTKDDFTKDNKQYDFVLDAVGKSSFLKCKRLLKKKGMYGSSDGLVNLLWVPITKLAGGKKVLLALPRDIKGGLSFIKDLIEKGNFKPVIDRKYPFEKIVEALTYAAAGQKIGNVIITMDA